MTERGTNEKAAKVHEGWERWCAEDSLDAIGWAGVFIWGALVLLADITGFGEGIGWWDGWGVFFVGVAAIVLGGTAYRWLVPAYRREGLEWGLVFGLVLLGIGLGDVAVWIWPLLLGGVGVAILYSVLGGRS
jgi:hypothetical protein